MPPFEPHETCVLFAGGTLAPVWESEEPTRVNSALAQMIVSQIGPSRVLDAPAGTGALMQALIEREVQVDGLVSDPDDLVDLPETLRSYCRVGSLLDPLSQEYDLIIMTVAPERWSAADITTAVANLSEHTTDVLLRAAEPGWAALQSLGAHVFDAWIEALAGRNFFWDTTNAWPGYRFRAIQETPWRTTLVYERRLWELAQECELRRELMLTQPAIEAAAETWRVHRATEQIVASLLAQATSTRGIHQRLVDRLFNGFVRRK